MKRKNSWEEQAFAEDARGPLGGFIWPPRSYSCSFCRREFKSAQALGGHMNVHRREKLKLNRRLNKNQNQEILDDHSSSDNKSCVYDEDLVVVNGKGDAETNLVLGFDLESCWNVGGKRQKINQVTPVIMQGGLDLELRLAN